MTTTDRRHRGRAIRRAHKRRPGTSVTFLTIGADLTGFIRAMDRLTKAFAALGHTYKHPRQIIHNGKKP